MQRIVVLISFLFMAWAAEPCTAWAPIPSFHIREINRLEKEIFRLHHYELAWNVLSADIKNGTVWAQVLAKGGNR